MIEGNVFIERRKSGIYTVQFAKKPRTAELQHFVPKFHLENFSSKKGRVWVYRKDAKLLERPTKKVAVERDFNEYSLGDEQSKHVIEEMLGVLETAAGEYIPRMIPIGSQLQPEEISYMASYFASFILRTRRIRDQLLKPMAEKYFAALKSDPGTLARIQERVARKGEIITKDDLSERLHKRGQEILSQPAYFHFLGWKDIILKLAELLAKKTWRVIEAPLGKVFVTSDAPICYFHIEQGQLILGGSPADPAATCYLALGSKHALLMTPKAEEWGRQVDSETVDTLNECTIRYADREVYAAIEDSNVQELVNRSINTQLFDLSKIDLPVQ